MARTTLRQRFFPLHRPDEVDRLLERFVRVALFKAGTSDKTFDAWFVAQKVLEPRVDLPVGFVRLPEDRPASDRIAEVSGIPHRSPQFILFERGRARFHLDEFAITPEELVPRLREHLPAEVGPPVRNEAVVSLEPYRALLTEFVAGRLPEERFQWAYLDRLEKDAAWRDDETFDALNGLFENPDGRELRAPRLVALEFQAQIAGRREPLKARAERMLDRLADEGRDEGRHA
ncbi:MAG TPA: monothiol bacilliredoxin BrxC family protein [Vicinamibacterales bacterium]|nr:monothiol bacilliredoxin BrxC family protein [Vicinamibacterales bacterium]